MNDSVFTVNWNEFIPTQDSYAITEHLNFEKKSKMYNLIDRYGSVFAKNKYDTGQVKDYEAHNKLLENKYSKKTLSVLLPRSV